MKPIAQVASVEAEVVGGSPTWHSQLEMNPRLIHWNLICNLRQFFFPPDHAVEILQRSCIIWHFRKVSKRSENVALFN
jgi:hypothetical protein